MLYNVYASLKSTQDVVIDRKYRESGKNDENY